MTERQRERQLVAEIDFSRDPETIVWVGSRPLHHFWALLSPYFRDVLLPPHRRAEDDSVAWHWREPTASPPLRAAEFAGLRKRLKADQQAFVDNLADDIGQAQPAGGAHGHGNVDQLGAVMEATIARLAALPDAGLASFACRTDAGLRLHSWSGVAAAAPRCPKEDTAPLRAAPAAAGNDAPLPTRRSSFRRALLAAVLLILAGTPIWLASRCAPAAAEAPSTRRAVEKTSAAENRHVPTTPSTPSRGSTARIDRPSSRDAAEPAALRTSTRAGSTSVAVTISSSESRQSELARDLVLPANDASLPATATGTPAAAGGTGSSGSGSTTTGAEGNSSATPNAQSAAGGNVESKTGASTEAASEPAQPPGAATSALLRRGTPLPADVADAATSDPRRSISAADDRERSPRESTARDNGESPATAAARREFRPRENAAAIAAEIPAARSSDAPSAGAAWDRTIRLRISPWRLRLANDAIVPTLPRPAGAPDTLDALRREQLRAKSAELPASFRTPLTRSGLSIERISVIGEITWSNLAPPADGPCVIRSVDGEPLAELSRAADGELTVRLAPDATARLWTTVERAPEDAPMPDGSARFECQPTERDAASRCEVLLTPRSAANTFRIATVRDRLTGWSLVAEIRIER